MPVPGSPDVRGTPFGGILDAAQTGATDRPLGGAVILLALLVPALAMGLLFGTTALEEFLFPRPAADDSPDAQADRTTDL
jgi:hypothetical protein